MGSNTVKWSEVEDRYLKIYYPKYGTSICSRLFKSPSEVAERANFLSLHANNKTQDLAREEISQSEIESMSLDDYLEMNRLNIKSMSFRYERRSRDKRVKNEYISRIIY